MTFPFLPHLNDLPLLLIQYLFFYHKYVGLLLLSFSLKSERNVLHFIWSFGMPWQSNYKKFIMYSWRYIIYINYDISPWIHTNKLCIKCYNKWVLVSSTSKISCCLCFWCNTYSSTTSNFFCCRTSFALTSERNVLLFIWSFGMRLQSYYKKFIMYAWRYIIYVMLHMNKLCIKCYI